MSEVVISRRMAVRKRGNSEGRDYTGEGVAKLLESARESHDEVVFAVLEKKVDVGTVRNKYRNNAT